MNNSNLGWQELKFWHVVQTALITVLGVGLLGITVGPGMAWGPTANAGFVIAWNGFAVQVGSDWWLVYKTHPGLINIPVLTWPWIGFFLASLYQLIFDWDTEE